MKASSRRWLIAAAGLAIIAAGWWFSVSVLGVGATETVADLLESQSELVPVEATSELCVDPACVEGWKTTHGVFLRFDHEGNAEYWETVLGDEGRRWGRIVLDF